MSIGRGLGALIAPSAQRNSRIYATGENSAAKSERIWQVPLTEITPDPKQPRRNFNSPELEELSISLKEHGVLQPLLVSELGSGGYQIIAGERRYRAAKIAGLTTVPVIVKTLADNQRLEVSLVENIQRADLNPIEEAFAYQRLIEEFGLTQEQVAQKVGKNRSTVANFTRLLTLPTAIQTALIEGKISVGQAKALLSITDSTQQLEALSSMQGEKITVRELERVAQTKRSSPARRDPNLLYLEQKLREVLGTKVAITQKGESGTITISYFSKEELTDIIKKIVG